MNEPWPVLDDLDQGIIKMLSEDASLSNTALAQSLGVTHTTIGTRVRKLAENGVMQVVAETDVIAAGYPLYAGVEIGVRGRSAASVAHALVQIPEAIVVCSILGKRQLLVQLIARDNNHLLQLIEEIHALEGVREVRAVLSLRTLRYSPGAKGAIQGSTARSGDVEMRRRVLQQTALADKVDALDLEIIAFLQDDGRRSLREIARRMKVSEGTIRARVKRLDQAKLLRRVAVVEPLAIGFTAHAFINLTVDAPHLAGAADALAEMPEIGMLAILLGEFDLVAVVSVHDRRELSRLVNEELSEIEGLHVHEVAEVVETFKQDPCWTIFVD